MKALGVEQAILVGHSAGALTAMEVFKRYLLYKHVWYYKSLMA